MKRATKYQLIKCFQGDFNLNEKEAISLEKLNYNIILKLYIFNRNIRLNSQ